MLAKADSGRQIKLRLLRSLRVPLRLGAPLKGVLKRIIEKNLCVEFIDTRNDAALPLANRFTPIGDFNYLLTSSPVGQVWQRAGS